MSNPTELPSPTIVPLPEPHMELCYFEGGDPYPVYNRNHMHAYARDYALAVLARRAQPEGEASSLRCDPSVGFFVCGERAECTECRPEGEAPQAVAIVGNADFERGYQAALKWCDENWAKPAATLSPLCGAQHAESGAPDIEAAAKAIYELLPLCQGKSAKDYPWQPCGNSMKQEEARDYARAAIAAQSQGAHRAPGTPEAPQTAAARDVLAERQRQIEAEGWTPERDDEYDDGALSLAAACYAMAGDGPYWNVPVEWPWERDWWKPTDDRRNLVKAGALILADIERLDRAAQLDGGQEGSESNG